MTKLPGLVQLPASRRWLSFSEKQKRKQPQPLECTDEEYEKQAAIVAELRAKGKAITEQITPMQRREADLRKKEYELWQSIRAIKRHITEQGPRENREYLKWEVSQRQRRDDEERAGTRKPHVFQTLLW